MSDVESEDEQVHQPSHPELVEVDVSSLTPLSPEVISKQVNWFHNVLLLRLELTHLLPPFTGYDQPGQVLRYRRSMTRLTLYTFGGTNRCHWTRR
jgi:predicted component of type VI protein secretion system